MAKIVFFSSSHRALPAFKLLQKNLEIVGVVSSPDKPVGRKAVLTPTAISHYAQEQSLPLLKPEKLDAKAIAWIADKKPDVLLLSYYGLWIPPELFNLTPAGILVTHPSLLPQWRWGSPVQATLLSGQKETGVTLMKMDEKFDHGPIVAVEKEEVLPSDDQESLYTRLFTKGAELAMKVLPDYLGGKITPQPQNHKEATFARHITRDDGFIPPKYLISALSGALSGLALQGETFKGSPWTIPWMLDSQKHLYSLQPTPHNLELFIRAMSPWPGAWSTVIANSDSGKVTKRLKLLCSHLEGVKLNITEVQLEGRNKVSWKQFRQWQPQPLSELLGVE